MSCRPNIGGRALLLDVRSLCLIREALAYRSGIADFAFAMQGLGTGSITLFGSDEQKRSYLPPVVDGREDRGVCHFGAERRLGCERAADHGAA